MNIKRLSDYLCQVRFKKLKVWIGESSNNFKNSSADIIIAPNIDAKMSLIRKDSEPFIITSPGEYEVSGISIFGEKEFFILETGDTRICYISKADPKLTESELEEIDGVDILLLPVKKDALSADKIKNILGQIQPNILIPLGKNGILEFLKTAGLETTKTTDNLAVSKSEIPEEMEVVILK